MFEKKGYIVVAKKTVDEDKLMGIVLDAGAEDLVAEEENFAVKTSPADFFKVKKALEENSIKAESAEITLVPKSTVRVVGDDAKKILDLIDAIEEHEDVQNVYANFDIPDELIKE